jgi:hypothetical protein
MGRTDGKNPHKHEGRRARDARHREDVERAAHNFREQQRQHRPAAGSVMVRRPIAYSWRDPSELRGLVPEEFLAPWDVPGPVPSTWTRTPIEDAR